MTVSSNCHLYLKDGLSTHPSAHIDGLSQTDLRRVRPDGQSGKLMYDTHGRQHFRFSVAGRVSILLCHLQLLVGEVSEQRSRSYHNPSAEEVPTSVIVPGNATEKKIP